MMSDDESDDENISDVDRALNLAAIIGAVGLGGEERLVMVTIPGNPPSKARARHTRKGRVYSDPVMVRTEKRTGGYIEEVIRGQKFTGNVALGCIFFRADMYRQDLDNMIKHVCDAANKIAWKDDCQVTAVLGMVEYDPVNPRTLLVFTSHESSLRRGTDDVQACLRCGSPIERRAKRKYCSDECRRVPKGPLAEPIPCPTCGKSFKRFTESRKYCSRPCIPRRGKPRPTTGSPSKCATCGKQLSHNRGGRCRDCWRANPQRSKNRAPGG